MLGIKLKEKREQLGLKIQEISANCGIDQALLSKYEGGKRIPSEKHIHVLAGGYEIPYPELKKAYLSEKVYELVKYEYEDAHEIFMVAESRIEYLSSKEARYRLNLSENIISRLEKLDKLKDEWTKNKPLNQTQLRKLNEHYAIKYTFDSNKIEGNTLSLYETQLVVNEGITINGKSMREHLEAINHSEAIYFVEDLIKEHEPFSKRNLLNLHALILKSIDSPNAGIFRKVPVAISGTEFMPPQPFLLDKLMEDYFIYYQSHKRDIHPVIMAAEMHERLVSIHPFIDGNGRTSRLVMNYLLLQSGYTIAILKGDYESKMAYFDALKAVQNDNNSEPFYELVINRAIESLQEHLNLA